MFLLTATSDDGAHRFRSEARDIAHAQRLVCALIPTATEIGRTIHATILDTTTREHETVRVRPRT